jgi:hypothetical protein
MISSYDFSNKRPRCLCAAPSPPDQEGISRFLVSTLESNSPLHQLDFNEEEGEITSKIIPVDKEISSLSASLQSDDLVFIGSTSSKFSGSLIDCRK